MSPSTTSRPESQLTSLRRALFTGGMISWVSSFTQMLVPLPAAFSFVSFLKSYWGSNSNSSASAGRKTHGTTRDSVAAAAATTTTNTASNTTTSDKKSFSLFPKAIEIDKSLNSTAGAKPGFPTPCATDSNFNLVELRNHHGTVVGWDVSDEHVDGPTYLENDFGHGTHPGHGLQGGHAQSYFDISTNTVADGDHFDDLYSKMFITAQFQQQPIVQQVQHQQSAVPNGRVARRNLNRAGSNYSPYDLSSRPSHQSRPSPAENISDREDTGSVSSSIYDSFSPDVHQSSPPELMYTASPSITDQTFTANWDGASVPEHSLDNSAASNQLFMSDDSAIVGVSHAYNGIYPLPHSGANSENGDYANEYARFQQQDIPKETWHYDYHSDGSVEEGSINGSTNNSNVAVASAAVAAAAPILPMQDSVISPVSSVASDFHVYSNVADNYTTSPEAFIASPPHLQHQHSHESITTPNSQMSTPPASEGALSGAKSENNQFACTECGASFRIKGYLTRHMKKHASNKAYNCPFYNSDAETPCHPSGGFSRRDTYKTHLKARHFLYPSGTRSEHRCKVSGKCGGCGAHYDNNEAWVEEHIQKGLCKGTTVTV